MTVFRQRLGRLRSAQKISRCRHWRRYDYIVFVLAGISQDLFETRVIKGTRHVFTWFDFVALMERLLGSFRSE